MLSTPKRPKHFEVLFTRNVCIANDSTFDELEPVHVDDAPLGAYSNAVARGDSACTANQLKGK